MLPKENRLRDRGDFGKVYKNGKFFSLNDLTLRFTPNDLPLSRIGFSVSKSLFKKAVDRNRVRRLLREAARKKITAIRPGFDLVISYGSKIKNPALTSILETLEHILKRCHLLT